MRSIVTATQLNSWFDPKELRTQGLLPELIRLLILATVPPDDLIELRIPSRDQITQPGYDGVVEVRRGTLYVPAGRSVWEMGTERSAKQKAEKDYTKRTGSLAKKRTQSSAKKSSAKRSSATKRTQPPDNENDPNKELRSTSTFAFVTPHDWAAKATWMKEKRRERKWKSVETWDATDLDTWLLKAPAVARWLAAEFGVPVKGMYDIDRYLAEKIRAVYGIEFPTRLILGERQGAIQQVQEWLTDDERIIRIQGESPTEGAAFIAAVIKSMDRNDRESIAARTLFIDDPDALDFLGALQVRHIVVALTPSVIHRAEAINSPMVHCIYPIGSDAQSEASTTIRLAPLQSSVIGKEIASLLGSKRKAYNIARESKGSLEATLMMVATRSDGPPDWARGEVMAGLVPILLAGQWNSQMEGDRSIIEALCQRSYDEIEQFCTRLKRPYGPLFNRQTIWDWVAWPFAFTSLSSGITQSVIDRFTSVCIKVLGTRDPALDLPVGDRWMAAIHGKTHPYSSLLQMGLVKSLLYLAVQGEHRTNFHGPRVVNDIVRSLLDGERAERAETWLSLKTFLPSLAEAAPEVFITSLRRFLNIGADVGQLFEGATIFGMYGFIEVGWALASLAWSEEWLSRVVLLLGSLAEHDPNPSSNYRGRPIDVLTAIFLPWYPATSATVAVRLEVLDVLIDRHPNIAWTLLMSLLPGGTTIASSLHEPELRSWKEKDEVTTTRGDYEESVTGILTRILGLVGHLGSRWGDLIGSYTTIRQHGLHWATMIIDKLKEAIPSDFSDSDRKEIADKIRKLILNHRNLPDAAWVMPNEDLENFELLLKSLDPDDPMMRHEWLFHDWPTIPGEYELSYDERIKWLQQERASAIREIYEVAGSDGVLKFADSVPAPGSVGAAMALLKLKKSEELIVLSETLALTPKQGRAPSRLLMGYGYVGWKSRSARAGWEKKAIVQLGQWASPTVIANLAIGLPMQTSTWDLVESQAPNVSNLYWSWVPLWRVEDRVRDLEPAMRGLMRAGRYWRAVDLMCLYIGDPNQKKHGRSELPVPTKLVIQVLQDTVRYSTDEEPFPPSSGLGYHIDHVLEILRQRRVATKTLARLEWIWFSALEHGEYGSQALYKTLASDPELFVDMIKYLYHADGNENAEASQNAVALATQAYHVLHSLDRVPGARDIRRPTEVKEGDIVFPSGTVDRMILFEWYRHAHELAAEAGREGPFYTEFGKVLSHSPHGEDGTWPCSSVRDLIESIEDDRFHDGIVIGVLNSRGIHSKGANGHQEHAIAKKFREYEKSVRTKYPRTGEVLSGIAKSFEAEARREEREQEATDFG